ncbi:MAG: PAS domain-containing protein, partial [Lentisphaerae bacterium]|nr:PAS domain-containing protein [Lentisphaerota bacterium]
MTSRRARADRTPESVPARGEADYLSLIRRLKESLDDTQTRFHEMAESIREAFWMTDPGSSRMLYVSPAYEQIWGRTRKELEQHPRSWMESIHAADRAAVKESLERQRQGEATEEQFRITRPDGSVRWIENRAFPVCDAEGRVYRITGVAADITERRRLEQEILEVSTREQERIGRDLHDTLGQELTGITLLATALRRRLQAEQSPLAAQAEDIRAWVVKALEQTRRISSGLSPVDKVPEGLANALRNLCEMIRNVYDLRCRCRIRPPARVPDHPTATHLYYIAL